MWNFSGSEGVKQNMRYWGFFLGKVLVALGISFGLFQLLQYYWPPHIIRYQMYAPRFGQDLSYTFVVGLWFLLSWCLVYLCIWDQKYRCRVCLRKLRMPILTGSWNRMLQYGRPEIEYICTYGHGKLNVPELQITGKETAAWTPKAENIWAELEAVSRSDRDE